MPAYAAERPAPYKKPARIVVMDALPVGPTGKIARSDLKAMAACLDAPENPAT